MVQFYRMNNSLLIVMQSALIRDVLLQYYSKVMSHHSPCYLTIMIYVLILVELSKG
jgi:hypothetical protein